MEVTDGSVKFTFGILYMRPSRVLTRVTAAAAVEAMLMLNKGYQACCRISDSFSLATQFRELSPVTRDKRTEATHVTVCRDFWFIGEELLTFGDKIRIDGPRLSAALRVANTGTECPPLLRLWRKDPGQALLRL
jgi:hypothetical protein